MGLRYCLMSLQRVRYRSFATHGLTGFIGNKRCVVCFEKRWSQYARPVGRSWRCDETYIKVKGRWTYLYRAVDKLGSNGRFPVE